MYRIATNESLTFIKQKAKKNNTSTEEINAKIIDNLQSDVFFDGNEIQIKLQKAIALLPTKQQLVFKNEIF